MSTVVYVHTRTHSVTYATDRLLTSLKDIVRRSGLSPEKLTNNWHVLERGIKRWLETGHLEEVHLEVYDPANGVLVGRWDFTISYEYVGSGAFWADSDAIAYHIKKAGLWPGSCDYRVVVTTAAGRPDVDGWSATTLRSTAGFVRQSVGTSIDASGLRAGASYWRKVS